MINEDVGTELDPLIAIVECLRAENSEFKRPRKILFVEDDSGMRMLFQRLSEGFNCVVDYAADGEEGLRLALKGTYDLIILDIVLPNMDGIEVFANIRRVLGYRPPIAFFTGVLDNERGKVVAKIGFAPFIKKPDDFNAEFIHSFFEFFNIKERPQ